METVYAPDETEVPQACLLIVEHVPYLVKLVFAQSADIRAGKLRQGGSFVEPFDCVPFAAW